MTENSDLQFPYPSIRLPAFGDAGVATTQPQAAQAGLAMLQKGGNAVDAALATAIALTVLEPTSNGVGSDAFAIVWDGKKLHGLNGSGRSPAGWSRDRFGRYDTMPQRGWDAVTVPGAVSSWVELSRRFGRLQFADLFEPAIRYARDGFLVPVFIARNWATQTPTLRHEPTFRSVFLPHDRPPLPGERFFHRDLVKTLERIAQSGGESFYRGELAGAIAAFAAESGAALSEQDLAEHRADWIEPISVGFGDVTVHELPPNGQGIATLIALGILDQLDLPDNVDDSRTIHVAIEAMRLALADMHREVTDPDFMRTKPEEMLSMERLAELAAKIDPNTTSGLVPKPRKAHGTVYVASADRDGMIVSFIQSNFMGFGSGIVVPGTGIALQNRGAGFSLEHGHPNEIGPRKRTMNTIIPGFLTRKGKPLAAFGIMGGAMQAQAHTQVVLRMEKYGQHVQAAVDAPRWMVDEDGVLAIEHNAPNRLVHELANMGHEIRRMTPFGLDIGAAQIIRRLPQGGYIAATESRREGIAAMI